jgi:hypothetical protein
MTKFWKDCVLPEADIHYTETVREMQRKGPQEIFDNPSEDPEGSLSVASRPRSVMTYDGCWQQLNAVFLTLNEELSARGMEGFKFAAASTMTMQPNDVGHMHKALKKCFKGKKYRAWKVVVPPYLEGFDDTLADHGLEPGSLTTYWKALCNFEIALSRACTMPMVSKGFKISGIYPLDQVRMLSKWSGWRMCTKQTALDVVGKLPMLTNIAKQRGRVLDGEIEACLEGILTFDAATRKSDDCALNHSRCMWTNNSAVIEMFSAKRQSEMLRTVHRDNIIMEREWRKANPEEAALEDARVRARVHPQPQPDGGDLPDALEAPLVPAVQGRVTKCSNPFCNVTGTKLQRHEWTRCTKKLCKLLFCQSCIETAVSHSGICNKQSKSRAATKISL